MALGVDGPGKRPSVPQGKPLTAGLAELVLEEASPETAIVEARPGLVNAFVLCSASLARGVGPPGSSLSPIIFPIHPPCV